MTTNAIDRQKRILASDSRWSSEDKVNQLLFYVDDTGFDKIGDRGFGTIICAGDGILIDEWRAWFSEPILNTAALPRTNRHQDGELVDITISVWVKPQCTAIYSNGAYILHGLEALFCGSGAFHAYTCYAQNRCSKQSIVSAAILDDATGGETKYVEFDTGKHNLSAGNFSLADATRQLTERGMVMDLQTKKVVPIQELAANGIDAFNAIANGSIPLSAPTGQPARQWLDAEREELRKAFEHIADLEAKDRAVRS